MNFVGFKNIQRIGSVVLAFCFVVTTIQAGKIESGYFEIPEQYGVVLHRHGGDPERHVVIIQDLHTNPSAQFTIADILEYLERNSLIYGKDRVFVEGAAGHVSTGMLKGIPDEGIRREICDYYVKSGYLSGSEYASILGRKDWSLFGIEEPGVYLQNMKLFKQVQVRNAVVSKGLDFLVGKLAELKQKIYTWQEIEFESFIDKYWNNYQRLCPYLARVARGYGIDISLFSQFGTMLSILELEEVFDLDEFMEERKVLLFSLQSALDKTDKQMLLSRSLAYRTGKMSAKEYYDFLAGLIQKTRLAREHFFQVTLYHTILSLFDTIDDKLLQEEIGIVTESVSSRLMKSDDARLLKKVIRDISVLRDLISLSLTRNQYRLYREGDYAFNVDSLCSRIGSLCRKYDLSFSCPAIEKEIADLLPLCKRFYDLVVERDKLLFSRFLQEYRSFPQKMNVLVVGGFHSEGIVELLKEAGFSYTVVLPFASLDRYADRLYRQVMTEKGFFIDTLLFLWTSTLAPRIREANELADPAQEESLCRLTAVLYLLKTIVLYRDDPDLLRKQLRFVADWSKRSDLPFTFSVTDTSVSFSWGKSQSLVIYPDDLFWQKDRSCGEIVAFLQDSFPVLIVSEDIKRSLQVPAITDGTDSSA